MVDRRYVIIVATIIVILIGYSLIPKQTDFEKETEYYKNKEEYIIDNTQAWSTYNQKEGEYSQLSGSDFRKEAEKVIDALSVCRIYLDPDVEVMWISGVGPDNTIRYVYFWSPIDLTYTALAP